MQNNLPPDGCVQALGAHQFSGTGEKMDFGVEQHFSGAAAHPPLLVDIRHDKEQERQEKVFAGSGVSIQIGGVMQKLALQVAHIHGALVPFEPEAKGTLPRVLILRAGIRLEALPASSPGEASGATRATFPPAQASGESGQPRKEIINAAGVRELIEESSHAPLLQWLSRGLLTRQVKEMPVGGCG